MTLGGSADPDELRNLPLEERLVAVRTSAAMSQQQVADAVGRSVRTVNRWESASFPEAPNRSSRQRLAELFGLPERFFLRTVPNHRPHHEEVDPLRAELVALREVIEGAVAHRDKWQNRLEKRIDRQLSSQELLLARLTELADALADRQQALQNVTANLESAATNLATVADRLETASRARPPQSQARKKA